ncbi:MAG: ferredoxin, partial [Clostridia bacterium]|nr:ferredoxin [Clostridia bacterium]
PECKNIFIGPCTAKKSEFQRDEYAGLIDSVITFEELQALIDSKDIDVNSLEETDINHASYFGRIFARSGGVSEAVSEALKEQNSDFELKPIACSGIDDCKKALMLAARGLLPNNFIEGMACVGGCINGAGCLTHGDKNKTVTDNYGKESKYYDIATALNDVK